MSPVESVVPTNGFRRTSLPSPPSSSGTKTCFGGGIVFGQVRGDIEGTLRGDDIDGDRAVGSQYAAHLVQRHLPDVFDMGSRVPVAGDPMHDIRRVAVLAAEHRDRSVCSGIRWVRAVLFSMAGSEPVGYRCAPRYMGYCVSTLPAVDL